MHVISGAAGDTSGRMRSLPGVAVVQLADSGEGRGQSGWGHDPWEDTPQMVKSSWPLS